MIYGCTNPMFTAKAMLKIVSTLLCSFCFLNAQVLKGGAANQAEQANFGIEDPKPQRPVDLTRAALDALSKDERVARCLKKNGLSAQELPSNWFVASEIHLDGPNEEDLVVLPGGRIPDTPKGAISPNVCLLGANTGQMWVLRKMQTGFQVVLSQIGLGMNVLATRTGGFRDIQVGAAVGGYVDGMGYQFDGNLYQISRRTSELVGAKVPDDLTGYESKSLFQLPGQSRESICSQAREWIWEMWWQKRSYLTVEMHDDEADETTSYYIAPDSKGEWQITMKIHRVLRATPTQGSITEDKLSIATDIERIEPTAEGASHRPRVIPDTEVVPESKYRLQFLDYGDRIIATL